MGYWISKFVDIGQFIVLKSYVPYCFANILVPICCSKWVLTWNMSKDVTADVLYFKILGCSLFQILEIWYPILFDLQCVQKEMRRYFVNIPTNILEGWDIFHLKGDIHRYISSIRSFLCNVREPRYNQNNMVSDLKNNILCWTILQIAK